MSNSTTQPPHICKYCKHPTDSHAPTCRFLRLPTETRFWMNVKKSDGCWEWTGYRNPAGYGRMRMGGRQEFMHRFSWELHFGAIPEGISVCHRCDNPACVRPDHLFIGTHSDNMFDKFVKGRAGLRLRPERAVRGDDHWTRLCPENLQRGENNPQARFTERQVREMRDLYQHGSTLAAIARRYETSKTAVSGIVKRKTWRHVE